MSRTHGAKIAAEHKQRKLTPAQIRRAKCERTKARNGRRREERIEQAAKIAENWTNKTPEQQLAELDKRPGFCLKQRVRIAGAMLNALATKTDKPAKKRQKKSKKRR